MASLSNIYVKVETLETILKTVKAKNEKGISIDISISDETNQYGQNLTAYISQTKEQRDAKAKRFYVGNGKNFWNDGKITKAVNPADVVVHQATIVTADDADSDLPF